MTGELHDDRQPGWYYIDNALHDEYGPKIGALGIAVYATLARHANRARVSWPSYSKIAASLALSRPTVIATVRVLVEHGLVRVETIKEDGRRPYNRYTLVKLLSHDIGKGDLPVKDVDQCTTGKAGLPVKDVSSTGKAGLPLLVKDVDCNKTQLTRPKEQDPKAAVAAGEPARIRTRPHARGTRDGADDGVAIPADLSPGDEERSQMVTLAIPQQWYFTKWWSIVEHYENKPEDKRTIEKWRWTCRHLISEDWAKELARTQTRSR